MDSKGLLFPLLFPSFFLLAAVGSPGLDRWSHHREVFGGGDYYLSLSYAGSPDGVLSGETSRFWGELVTPVGESRVRGVRRKQGRETAYLLTTDQGEFRARQKQGECILELSPVLSPKGLVPARLIVGTCPTHN